MVFPSFQLFGGGMQRLNWPFILFLIVILSMGARAAEPAEAHAIQQVLHGHEAAFALADLHAGAFFRYNQERCQQPLPALATLHLPLALLALDAGVIKDAQTVLPWNRLKYPMPGEEAWPMSITSWAQDHTLRSAFQQAVPWYFQELAQRLGAQSLQRSLNKVKFGQGDLRLSPAAMELGSHLEITVEGQLAFLQALYEDRLPLAKRAQRIARELLIREQTTAYTLRGVTGSGMLENGKYLGWFAGWLETRDTTCVIVFNLSGADLEAVSDPATTLLKRVLMLLGYLPKE
jgi:beta-lactamase class D